MMVRYPNGIRRLFFQKRAPDNRPAGAYRTAAPVRAMPEIVPDGGGARVV